jgi:hypothetical protein
MQAVQICAWGCSAYVRRAHAVLRAEEGAVNFTRPCLPRSWATTGQFAVAQSGCPPARRAPSSLPSAQQPARMRDFELTRGRARALESRPGGNYRSLSSAQHGAGTTDVGRALPGADMHSMCSNPALAWSTYQYSLV